MMRIDICAGLAALLLALSNPLRAQVVLSEVMHDPGGLDHLDEYRVYRTGQYQRD